MLKNLGFSYTTLMLVNISATVFTLLFSPVLGKFADKYGNRELLKVGGILVSLIPFFWLFSSPLFYHGRFSTSTEDEQGKSIKS